MPFLTVPLRVEMHQISDPHLYTVVWGRSVGEQIIPQCPENGQARLLLWGWGWGAQV